MMRFALFCFAAAAPASGVVFHEGKWAFNTQERRNREIESQRRLWVTQKSKQLNRQLYRTGQASESVTYVELLQRVAGLEETMAARMNSRQFEKLAKIAGRGNIIHATERMIVVMHDGLLKSGKLAEVHGGFITAGFRPHRMLAHHSTYVKEGTAHYAWNDRHEKKRRFATLLAEEDAQKSEDFVPGVAVCVTTIPSHLISDKSFNVTVEALMSVIKEQDYTDSKITGYLTIAAGGAEREKGDAYPVERLANLTKMFDGSLVIVTLEHDVGPASRYVGCAEALREHPEEYIIAFDDDIAYEPHAVSTLVCAKKKDPTSTFTGHSFGGANNQTVGQGADGLIFSVGDLGGDLKDEGSYSQLMKDVTKDCFKVDDLSISDYLYQKGRPVKTLEKKQQDESCGVPGLPLYKHFCWNGTNKANKTYRVCRPTIRGSNSLRSDYATGGRGSDMYRCADALLRARGKSEVYYQRGFYNRTVSQNTTVNSSAA